MGTRGAWARDFLQALGNSNPSNQTVNLVAAWTKGENTRAQFNPLATTLDYGDNTKFNNCCGGNGVKNYKTREQGIQASIMTLQGKHAGYADIVKGLVNNDPNKAYEGMLVSPWGTNFVHVGVIWRTSDVTGEPLKSEEGGSVSGGDWSNPDTTEPEIQDTVRSLPQDEYLAITNPTGTVSAMSVKKALKIALGVGIAVIASGMLIYSASKTDVAKIATKVATRGIV